MTTAVKAVVFDMEGTDIVDLQGANELAEVANELKDVQITFYLARVKAEAREALGAYGALDEIEEGHIFEHVEPAVAAASRL